MDLNLGRSCSQMGPSWGHVAPSWSQVSWAEVGALLAEVDPKSGQCCGHVGSKRRIWTMLGRSAKRANYHRRVHFSWRPALSKMPHPQLKLYQSDRSVRLYPSLLNYHALAPPVRAGLQASKPISLGGETIGYTNVHTYIRTYMHACIHVYVYIYICKCMCTCICICMCICMCIRVCIRVYVLVYVNVNVYVKIYRYKYMYMHMHMSIYLYIARNCICARGRTSWANM